MLKLADNKHKRPFLCGFKETCMQDKSHKSNINSFMDVAICVVSMKLVVSLPGMSSSAEMACTQGGGWAHRKKLCAEKYDSCLGLHGHAWVVEWA